MKRFSRLSVAEKYIVLALAADKLVKDRTVVFLYFGPLRLKRYLAEWTASGLSSIINELLQLETEANGTLADKPPVFRRTYLTSQIRSLRCLLDVGNIKLKNRPLVEAVTNVLGFKPRPPYDMALLKREEQAVLNSYNYDSYKEFQKDRPPESKVTGNELKEWMKCLIGCFQKDIVPHLFCGAAMKEFAGKSSVKLARYRRGYPACYYMYHGRNRGTIYLSGGHKKSRLSAIRTLLHEFCPGHHVYYVYRELLARLGILGEEATIDLIYSSETPISEGVAETALFYLKSLDGELYKHILIATAREHFCKKVLYNVWHHRYVEEKMSEKGASAYLLNEGGFENERIDAWLKFIDGWRIYYPAYPAGTEIIKNYLATNSSGLSYLYLPKSLSVLEKLKQSKRPNVRKEDL